MEESRLSEYMEGKLKGKELEDFLNELEENEELRKEFYQKYSKDTLASMPNSFSDSSVFSKRILPYMHKHEYGRTGKQTAFYRFFRVAVAVAASLFIPLLAYNVYQLYDHFNLHKDIAVMAEEQISYNLPHMDTSAMLKYSVNPGVKGFVSLPDGSKVWLNSNSEISFPAEFDSTARNVSLKGEAFFDVISDKSRPMFILCKNDVFVKVTGTKFNLTSYDNDSDIKLLLVSGNVNLIDRANGRTFPVKPSEQIVVFDSKMEKPYKVLPDIKSKTAWKDGYLIFDNTPMTEVVKRLERWYGVTVILKNEEISDYSFTATFKSESIFRVLEILYKSSNIKYEVNDNVVILDL